MQKLTTATGKEFRVLWCSVVDVLRFAVIDSDIMTLLGVFMNPEETATLTNQFDERVRVYEGYTKFKGVELDSNGSIIVALMQEN